MCVILCDLEGDTILLCILSLVCIVSLMWGENVCDTVWFGGSYFNPRNKLSSITKCIISSFHKIVWIKANPALYINRWFPSSVPVTPLAEWCDLQGRSLLFWFWPSFHTELLPNQAMHPRHASWGCHHCQCSCFSTFVRATRRNQLTMVLLRLSYPFYFSGPVYRILFIFPAPFT